MAAQCLAAADAADATWLQGRLGQEQSGAAAEEIAELVIRTLKPLAYVF